MSKIEVDAIDKQSGSTLTLGGSGTAVTLACGATQSGFGRTGTVDWQTSIKTAASFTAVNGEGYFVDTSSNAVTANLPAGSVGAIVAFKDYAQNFDTNALTIAANGSDKIEGQTFDLVLDTEGKAVTLVYGDATKGWQAVNSNEVTNVQKFVAATGGTETTVCTNFKVHTFTGPGTFSVSCAGSPSGSNTVDYIVIAGGGSGGLGSGNSGGGGGAGGYRESSGSASGCYSIGLPANSGVSALPITSQCYPITVGAGGASVPNSGNGSNIMGNRGSNSIFSSITSTGGGGGGASDGSITNAPGGSGGGGAGGGQCRPGGTGNTPPVTPSQGHNGGSHTPPHSPDIASTGGGGASQAGQNNGVGPIPEQYGTNGGIGATSSISGSAVGYAGGGGGGSYSQPGAGEGNTHNFPNGKAASPGVAVCAAAAFGGGEGGNWNNPGSGAGGESGGTNKGAGGGGTGYNSTGAGGSGIVIIRYKFQ